MFVLPTIIAPASRSRFTTVASYGLVKLFRIPDAAVVGKSAVHMLSFIAMSSPKGLEGMYDKLVATSWAAEARESKEALGVREMKAFR